MRLFGLDITRTRTKALPPQLALVDQSRGGWWPVVREPFTGAWQAGAEQSADTVLAFSALYSGVTLLAADVAKCRPTLIQEQDGVWPETSNPAWSPVLRRPNHFQNRIQFYQWWITSKLLHGNAYALKRRDARGVVQALYLMDPTRVTVLVAPDGSVFYQLATDNLADLPDTVTVPAREIIHDVMVPLFHPLIGVTPIYACGMAAYQGLKIQGNSTKFFAQGSQPGGVLTAPGTIAQATADRLKAYWEENFSGNNVGKVAVLGDGLKYEPMTVKAVDAQLIEQLKWTGGDVCSALHIPPYKVGIGPLPTYNNVEALDLQYYSQGLQIHFESLELLLDEGLELPSNYGIEFDLEGLFRMDSATQMDTAVKGVGGGIFTPNEARKKFDRKPLPGGDSAYLQQQYYSLEALNKRDTQTPAPPTPAPTPAPPPPEPPPGEPAKALDVARLETLVLKGAMENFDENLKVCDAG